MIDHHTLPTRAPTPANAEPTVRRRRRRSRGLVAVAVLGAALSLAACSSGGSSTATTSAPATTGGSGGSTITISNFMFAPMDLTVAPGATVTVVNKDSVAHTVTGQAGGFDTGDVQPGQSKTFTAPNKAGSYPYRCNIHQYMTGTLTVS